MSERLPVKTWKVKCLEGGEQFSDEHEHTGNNADRHVQIREDRHAQQVRARLYEILRRARNTKRTLARCDQIRVIVCFVCRYEITKWLVHLWRSRGAVALTALSMQLTCSSSSLVPQNSSLVVYAMLRLAFHLYSKNIFTPDVVYKSSTTNPGA